MLSCIAWVYRLGASPGRWRKRGRVLTLVVEDVLLHRSGCLPKIGWATKLTRALNQPGAAHYCRPLATDKPHLSRRGRTTNRLSLAISHRTNEGNLNLNRTPPISPQTDTRWERRQLAVRDPPRIRPEGVFKAMSVLACVLPPPCRLNWRIGLGRQGAHQLPSI